MIKVITFDLDGVYFPRGKENFINNLISAGVSEAEARRVFLHSDEMNFKYKTGLWTDEQYWNWALSQWQLQKTVPEIIDLLIAGYDVDPRVERTVRMVRAEGYQTAICSNNFPARINGLQKRFNFLDNFDVVVLSYEVGAIKPYQKIFSALIEKAGVNPAQILFTDDSESGLEAAKGLGITTHLYSNFIDFLRFLKYQGINFD